MKLLLYLRDERLLALDMERNSHLLLVLRSSKAELKLS
jgi:hypothetical protein